MNEYDSAIGDIYQTVFRTLLPRPSSTTDGSTSTSVQTIKLAALKRQRMTLQAEIAAARLSFPTVRTVLLQRHIDNQRPFVRSNINTNNPTRPPVAVEARLEWVAHMARLRHVRKLSAACLLSGWTVCSHADDTLSIRLDVAVQGTFVGCYHVFYQYVQVTHLEDENDNTSVEMETSKKLNDEDCSSSSSDDGDDHDNDRLQTLNSEQQNGSFWLQFKTDNLPKGIPVREILSKINCDLIEIKLPAASGSKSLQKPLESLQDCASTLYGICYTHAVKTAALEWLGNHKKTNTYAIDQARMVGNTISFRLVFKGDISLGIQLTYGEHGCWQALPEQVLVSNYAARRSGREALSVAEVSEDEEEAKINLAQIATEAFERFHVPAAVAEVVKAVLSQNGHK
jgi:hypothetical protein